jgi:hypothetical protein
MSSEEELYYTPQNSILTAVDAATCVNFVLAIGGPDELKSVCNILQAPFKNQYLDIGFKNKEDWVWSLIYYVLLGYNSTIHTVWVKRYEAGATLIKVLENLLKEANSYAVMNRKLLC